MTQKSRQSFAKPRTGGNNGTKVSPLRATIVKPEQAVAMKAFGLDIKVLLSTVDAVTKSLAKELGPRKIRVNSVNPSVTETEGVHEMTGFLDSPDANQLLAKLRLAVSDSLVTSRQL